MGGGQRLYVGCYTQSIRFGTGQVFAGRGEGIYLFSFDPARGTLSRQGLYAGPGAENPSFLTLSRCGGYLYAVNELKEWEGRFGGALSAFAVDRATGALTLLNRRPSWGTDPCHITLDPAEEFVFVSNFASGSICVYSRSPDGVLGEPVQLVQHGGRGVDPVRQAGPHPHSVTFAPGGELACVPDLGRDSLLLYPRDPVRGLRARPAAEIAAVHPGAGPRICAFHPRLPVCYLLGELDCTVTVLACDEDGGTARPLQCLNTCAGDRAQSTAAHIAVAPGGGYVYVSNRGEDSLAVFRCDPRTGALTPAGHTAAGGAVPRHFTLDRSGRWLVAAGQGDDVLSVFAVAADGALRPVSRAAARSPACVQFSP